MQHDYKSFQVETLSVDPIWMVGVTGSGKTTGLIQKLQQWSVPNWEQPPCLVFAALGDNRLSLVDRIQTATEGRYPFDSATPLSFFEQEVMLYWPLLSQQLNLSTPFPMRLRPETEQELATRLWQAELESGRLRQKGVSDYFMVRRTLDLMQLAAVSVTPHEQIADLLQQGFSETEGSPELWQCMGEQIQRWWQWCLDRGLLTYGMITELYWRYLLPHSVYQPQLCQRYRAVLADDVDEYPAVMRLLFEFFLDQGIPGCFTFNPIGSTRWGLGADPEHVAKLADRCQVETLPPPGSNLGSDWGNLVVDCIQAPLQLLQLPDAIQVIQTVSKAQLLRQTAALIATEIQAGHIAPEEIAIIAPGVDAITRYTLQSILGNQGIAVHLLNSQQPLISSPIVRALLNLLALLYPNLGRWVDREGIAEMLVVLSQAPTLIPSELAPAALTSSEVEAAIEVSLPGSSRPNPPRPNPLHPNSASPHQFIASKPRIDPVRAGLLTDYCFVPDPTLPRLLPATHFARWDRLGYNATQAYREILGWIENQLAPAQHYLMSNPVAVIDRAIQQFLQGGSTLPYDQMTILRELMETAQHYWNVQTRLPVADRGLTTSVGQFIQMLRVGTITANPFPIRPMGKAAQAITLATIYQYRIERCYHRWQFWLDAGSPFWLTGSGTQLFGAPLFWRDRFNRVWTAMDTLNLQQKYLELEIQDLLSRAGERVYLCHSDLAVNGQEQAGALMPLINAAMLVDKDQP
ncbi:MAG: recombinase family protein [Elainella sp. Prado103]|nr:recombinase family protein [Elainella sp. Prado103]